MKNINLAQQSKGFSLIELMVIVAIIGLLAAIAIPNYIRSRGKGYCSQAERDASNVERALSEYFSTPSHDNLPLIRELKITPTNPDILISGDPNEVIYITVKDRSGQCPDDYQRAHDKWDPDENTFTLEMTH
jgi:type IV pilus assembly protein PilA